MRAKGPQTDWASGMTGKDRCEACAGGDPVLTEEHQVSTEGKLMVGLFKK